MEMNVDNQEEKTARFLYFLLSITFENKLFIIWFLYFSKFHLSLSQFLKEMHADHLCKILLEAFNFNRSRFRRI